MMARRMPVVLASIVFATGCFFPDRWQVEPQPRPVDAAYLLQEDPVGLVGEVIPEEIVAVPIRERLRPCCAFGSDLGTSLLGIPIPFYRVPNLLDPGDLGPHTYDAGAVRVDFADASPVALTSEHNGLVYTCRGGFIDTAHVRDNVDWALFLAANIGRRLGERFTLELGHEAGRRFVDVEPIAPEVIDRIGRRRLAVWLAEWLSFQLSIWHEIATWYGFESVKGFPERASAFSPEDLYSNAIGGRLLAGIAYRRQAATADIYGTAVDAWLQQVLAYLGPVPKKQARELVTALDGLWWNSAARLPAAGLVQRRNFDVSSPVLPWRAPAAVAPPELRALCKDAPPLPVWVHGERLGVPLHRLVVLRVELDAERAALEPLRPYAGVVTQEDFPALVESIRQQALVEFGPRADRPD